MLLHRQCEGRHFDLMIENGPALATWKVDTPPEHASAEGIRCERIAEHRRRYLEYEGPLSGDRGHVARHDVGTCRVLERSETTWRVAFDGRHLTGVFRLERKEDQGATWCLAPA